MVSNTSSSSLILARPLIAGAEAAGFFFIISSFALARSAARSDTLLPAAVTAGLAAGVTAGLVEETGGGAVGGFLCPSPTPALTALSVSYTHLRAHET